MHILLRMTEDVPSLLKPNDVALWAFSRISDQYNEQASDKEAYLTYNDTDLAAAALDLVDGRVKPEAIRETANKWNARIDADFADAMARLIVDAPAAVDGQPVQYTKTENRNTIYNMKKAAMALDDSFYCFGEYALLVNKYGYFTTVLQPDQWEDILAHPEMYLTLEVYTK